MSAIEQARKLSVRELLVIGAMKSGKELGTALRDAGWGDWAQHHSGTWLADHPHVAQVLDNLREEILFDAAEVLRELIRNYAGLLIQEQRLQGMLGHDIMDLYHMNGTLMRIEMWPEAWRKYLVTEIETRESSERSHDGKTEDKPGGWDQTGVIRKIKRESTLAIEKELRECKKAQRECLAEIGRHVNVKAFPVPGDKVGDGLNNLANAINMKTVVDLASVCTPEQLEVLRQKALEAQSSRE